MNLCDEVRKLKTKIQVKRIYIYGTGRYAHDVFKILESGREFVDGFVVTVKNCDTILEHPVFNVDDCQDLKDSVIILGMNYRNSKEVAKYLIERGYDEERFIYANLFLDKESEKSGYADSPSIEISTVIGCRVNCKFCPQKVLIGNYYKNNSKRANMMSLDTFKKCMSKLPKECTIIFSGMSEPFLNPHCMDMIELACSEGRLVDLNTTFMGTNIDDVKRLSQLPLNFVVLHVADEMQYAKIPISEEYYQLIESAIEQRKPNGKPLINACSAQAKPDKRIIQICKEYEITYSMFDRAGNLDDDNLIRNRGIKGKVRCSACGENVNKNVLLPDGTLLLCPMDYGMKHVLGNLLESEYSEIRNGAEVNRIKRGLNGDEAIDILCRNCSNGHTVV